VPRQRSLQPSRFEFALVVAIFSGWFVLGSINAVLTGFPAPSLSDRDAIAIVAIEIFDWARTALIAVGLVASLQALMNRPQREVRANAVVQSLPMQ
jgi:hypothetical protein